MGLPELTLVAIALSMDAFAIAICKGLSLLRVSVKQAVVIGVYFGVAQAVMPLIGFFAASRFAAGIHQFDHWIAFILLGFIGARMVKDSRSCDSEEAEENPIAWQKMLPLAIATSIDALAVGISFAFLHVAILPSAALIGVTTFSLSLAGVYVGKVFGLKYKSNAELAGGLILIAMGFKILVEHLTNS